MKFLILFLTLFSSYTFAYDINELLDLYRKENDLSNKTKNEALGHLVVYTRDDIERMQAYHLSDLLKSHRIIRYNENLFGMPDYLHEDPIPYSSDLIKIYINDHEISSAFTGSGLFLYGNMELGFIDHVEIYSGISSNHVSTEPSVITIKLYTKDPIREEGASLQGYIGSRGTNHLNASYANTDKDLSYYFYASRSDANRQEYTHEGHTLSRDSQEFRALLTLSYKNFNVNAEVVQHTMNPFLSYSMFATPKESSIDYLLGRVGFTLAFLDDDSLTLTTSFSRIDEKADFKMDGTRWSSDFEDFFLPEDALQTNSTDDVFDLKLQKTFNFGMHHLISGSQFRSKQLYDVSAYSLGVKDEDPEYVDSKILSFYLQDDAMITDKQMVSLSSKINIYTNASNRNDEQFETYQARIGYIYTSDTNMFKSFVAFMQMPTEQHALTISKSYGADILDIYSFTAEYQHTFKKHRFEIFTHIIDNQINPDLAITGDVPDTMKTYGGSLKYTYDFDQFNSLESNLYAYETTSPVTGEDLKSISGYLHTLNSWNQWDLFNELIYYERLDSDTHGTDYTAAIRYHANNDLTISLKGNNIFNTAAKSEYRYLDRSTLIPSLQSLYYSPIDQFFALGLEYKF